MPLPSKRPPVALLALDIDGTLLPSYSTHFSERTVAALRAAAVAGVEIVIATGRRTAYAMPLLQPVGLAPDTLMISSNGAVTRDFAGNLLDRVYLPSDTGRALCAELRPFGGTTVFTFDEDGPGELVLESLERLHDRIAMWVDANLPYIVEIDPLERAFDKGDAPLQGMTCGTVAEMHAAEQHLARTPFADMIEMHRTEYAASDLCILDILPPGCNKGVALSRLAQRRGIARESVMAIGDNWNDLEMLKWAGQPVLMANAHELLHKEAAQNGWQVTGTNNDDGVAQAVEAALEYRLEALAEPTAGRA